MTKRKLTMPQRPLAITIICILLFGSISSASLQAAMVDTSKVYQENLNSLTIAQIKNKIEQTEVKQKLIQLGVDPEVVQSRIDNLSEEELSKLNQSIEELPAGAGAVGTLVLIFLVFVITDMIGATDVFPFVDQVN
jgi:predicted XRE-type DNA-binding protein